MLDVQHKKMEVKLHLIPLIEQIRYDHPTMGLRDMYFKIQPECIGRDAFEEFCKEYGFSVEHKKNFRRTTDSSGVIRFPNLLLSTTLTGINQVWSSDITYFEIKNRFYYLTFILDAYSRKIIGHYVSNRLRTEDTTLPALQMALKIRCIDKSNKLIFHSDGGGQYYDKDFLKLTGEYEIRNSMCEYAWENGKAERINGTIKNNYLIHREIENFKQLTKEVDRAVKLYNDEKPHIELARKSPTQFEKQLLLLPKQTTPTMTESLEAKIRFFGGSNPKNLSKPTPQNQDVLKANSLN